MEPRKKYVTKQRQATTLHTQESGRTWSQHRDDLVSGGERVEVSVGLIRLVIANPLFQGLTPWERGKVVRTITGILSVVGRCVACAGSGFYDGGPVGEDTSCDACDGAGQTRMSRALPRETLINHLQGTTAGKILRRVSLEIPGG